jgi:transaldolase
MLFYNKSAIQRLSETSEDMEIWWDSSPLIFNDWAKKLLLKTSEDERANLEKQLNILFDQKNPGETLFDGITTNPSLTRKVIDLLPEEVNPIIDKIIKNNPTKTNYELAWEVYCAITKKGAELYMPLFEKSGHRKGYVSAQVDPRLVTNVREMLKEALILKNLSPNIMIKCPGSKEGIFLIQILTSIGIPTNSTLVFHIPQVVEVAEAVKKGHRIGKEWGIDFTNWRSVITIMIGRFEERKSFIESAKEGGIELTDELKRWSGIAIAKKAHEILNDRKSDYLSKLLLCSSRVGPKEDEVLHIEKVAGGNLVYTINPEMQEDFMRIYKEKNLLRLIDEPVPNDIMKKLLRIPYFKNGYEVDGIKKEEFISHPAFVYTRDQFSDSMKEIEEYVIYSKTLKLK